ncbi:sensor histidine kinase [Paracnuella aquatica]|nr:sensor histidine kinase [Paracnuella aquatica]
MDAAQTGLYTYILIVSLILGAIILFFIISLVRQQRRNLRLYRQSLMAEITAMEQERARIAADLHDELGPNLSSVKLRISSFELPDETDRVQLEKTCLHIDGLIQRIREISYDLLPSSLTRKGLSAALQGYIEQVSAGAAMQVQFHATDGVVVAEEKAIHLYRIVQEVVHNALRHSGGTQINISLYQKDGMVVLETADDGVGFDHYEKTKSSSGLGLRNLLNRAEMIGGKMFVESGKNKGTRYTFEVPV